jgi:hypothetical protein
MGRENAINIQFCSALSWQHPFFSDFLSSILLITLPAESFIHGDDHFPFYHIEVWSLLDHQHGVKVTDKELSRSLHRWAWFIMGEFIVPYSPDCHQCHGLLGFRQGAQ